MKYVTQPVRKTDAMSLVTGKPVYTDDLAPKDCLIVKILRSPHANAWKRSRPEMQKKLQVSHVFLLTKMFHRSVLLWQDKLHRK